MEEIVLKELHQIPENKKRKRPKVAKNANAPKLHHNGNLKNQVKNVLYHYLRVVADLITDFIRMNHIHTYLLMILIKMHVVHIVQILELSLFAVILKK